MMSGDLRGARMYREKEVEQCVRDRDAYAQKCLDLESQLAALKPAAEAMGVLERLVNGDQFVRLNRIGDRNDARGHCICAVVRGSKSGDETFGEANSLIEAVLKAGGEGQ